MCVRRNPPTTNCLCLDRVLLARLRPGSRTLLSGAGSTRRARLGSRKCPGVLSPHHGQTLLVLHSAAASTCAVRRVRSGCCGRARHGSRHQSPQRPLSQRCDPGLEPSLASPFCPQFGDGGYAGHPTRYPATSGAAPARHSLCSRGVPPEVFDLPVPSARRAGSQ